MRAARLLSCTFALAILQSAAAQDADIHAGVKAAVAANEVEQTGIAGHTQDRGDFRDVPRDGAVLIGRPLAMVRARLQFLLDGLPDADPSWQYTFAPATPDITSYQFAIELGNIARLNDGLIGYFVGDEYGTFNVVAESGAKEGNYLEPDREHGHGFLETLREQIVPDVDQKLRLTLVPSSHGAPTATSAPYHRFE